MPFAKRSSTRAFLVAAIAAGGVVAIAAVALRRELLVAGALAVVALAAGLLALQLSIDERRRHRRIEESLVEEASALEALVESLGSITASLDEEEILERVRREGERLFGARATVLAADERREPYPAEHAATVPLRVRDEKVGALYLARRAPFGRDDLARARVLADFAARAIENARLVVEARVREAERATLADRVVTAEQEERRRLAVFLHDTSVQALAGIALMLDAATHAVETEQMEQASTVLASALERLRETIRAVRDLSFALEPVVLRDQGFGPAVRALADQIGLAHKIQVDVEVEAAESLGEKAQVALYQIVREALHNAVRRGPRSRIEVHVRQDAEGQLEAVVADDAPAERRRATFDAIEERARTLNGRLEIEGGQDGGTTVRVVLPPHAAAE